MVPFASSAMRRMYFNEAGAALRNGMNVPPCSNNQIGRDGVFFHFKARIRGLARILSD